MLRASPDSVAFRRRVRDRRSRTGKSTCASQTCTVEAFAARHAQFLAGDRRGLIDPNRFLRSRGARPWGFSRLGTEIVIS
jgi:hypothetical protein